MDSPGSAQLTWGSLGQTRLDAFLKTVTDVLLDGWTLTDLFPFDVASPSAHFTRLTITVRAGRATMISSDRPAWDALQISRATVSHCLGH